MSVATSLSLHTGADTYESYQQALRQVQGIAQDQSLEVDVLNADELNLNELLQKLQSFSLFSSGSAVLLKRPSENKEISSYLAENFTEAQKLPLVLWEPGKPDKRQGLIKKLQNNESLYEYAEPRTKELQTWMRNYLGQDAQSIGNEVYYKLIERAGANKWLLASELDKLKLYAQATGQLVTVEILEKLLGIDIAGDIWKFLDALSQGEKNKALQEYEKLSRHEPDTQYLLAMLSRELDLLASVIAAKDLAISDKELKLHPFVLEKTKKKARRFSWDKIKKLSQALVRLDIAIKQGKVEERSGLVVYLLSW